jgi:HlyD family secretion protein
MKTLLTVAAFVALIAGGVTLYGSYQRSSLPVEFRTARLERRDVALTVEATGTLEPEEVIDVGAQVVGRIDEFGIDPRGETDPEFANKAVTYGSEVNDGTVLAVIDDAVYKAQRDQARASLDRAKADLLQLDARLAQADAEWKRAQRLSSLSVGGEGSTRLPVAKTAAVKIRGIADADYVLAKANYEVALANLEVGRSVVAQQQSALDLAETNLSYTIIKSPVRGTIIDRRVNIGQTVVSSMNAPSLFLIAKDLRRMQVWASVNEADIGQLKTGTLVSFTVDAFPDDVFRGEVEQIRLNASMTQNVVIYTVVVAAENPDLKLLPYLTADVSFEVARRENVLTVPNGALRYQPRSELIAPSDAERTPPASESGSESEGTIWVRHGARLRPIPVQVGLSDRGSTEVSGPDVTEGLEVVVGEVQAGAAEQVNNPFAPKMPRTAPRS